MAGYAAALRLVDRTSLGAIGRALRADVGPFDPPADPDPELLEVLEGPFETVEGATERLARLQERLHDRGDRRAVFLSIYTAMTREVREGLDGTRFADPGWMRRYLVAFADYYRRAFVAFERGDLDAVPPPWRIAFGTAIRGDALVVQDAFLGVNAHVNHDLALALADVGLDPDREQKRADHRGINDVLARLVDAQQEALADVYAPGLGDVDAALGPFDESFTMLSLREGREQAWRIAVVLTDAGLPPVPAYARWVLRTTATGGALFVLRPAVDESLLEALHGVEAEGLDVGVVLESVGEG